MSAIQSKKTTKKAQSAEQPVNKLVEQPVNKPVEQLVDIIESIKSEWLKLTQEISIDKINLAKKEEKRNSLINQMCEEIKKNPSHVIIDSKIEDVKETTEVKPKATTEETSKPKAKSKAKSKAVDENTLEEPVKVTKSKAKVVEVEKPKVVEVEKPKGSKTKKAQPFDNSPKPDEDVPKPPVKKTITKITAPPKGTPKPKLENDSDEEVITMKPSDISSDSELSSASNISDDSDVSGGDDD